MREPEQPPPELCLLLAGVIEREATGFVSLRGVASADGEWSAIQVLPGTEHCTIHGLRWPSARYACTSGSLGTPVSARSHFDALARDLDDCLAKPIWFPRNWQRGEPFEFAMGERMLTWTDRSTAPPTQVVLKMQRAIDGPDYRVTVDLGAVP